MGAGAKLPVVDGLLDGIVAYPSQAAPTGCAAAYSSGVM